MKPNGLILTLIILMLTGTRASAVQWAVGTNAAWWAALGTINAEASVALARHLSVEAGVRYNPWSFGGDAAPYRARQRAVWAGARWWPWNSFSGWWAGGKVQAGEYSIGGIGSPRTHEGDTIGVGLRAGYSLMLHPHVNLDFGVGLWGGYARFKTYSCPTCGRVLDGGSRPFVMPDDVILTVTYIF